MFNLNEMLQNSDFCLHLSKCKMRHFLMIFKHYICFDADVERIILWCHLRGVALAFASRIRALKVCFHCFGKVFLWCCQRLQKDVKELPWAFQRFSPWLSVFFEDTQTASPSRFFSLASSTPRSSQTFQQAFNEKFKMLEAIQSLYWQNASFCCSRSSFH